VDIADFTGPDHLGALPGAFVGVALVAHLRRHFVFRGGFGQHAGFPDRPGERFLHIDVLAPFHASHGRHGVHEVRHRADHGIDVVGFLIEHLPKVFVLRRLLESLVNIRCLPVVHVAEGHDVFSPSTTPNVAGRLAAGANRGDIQFFVGRFIAQHFQGGRTAEAPDRDGSSQEAAKEEMSSRNCHI